MEWQIPIESEHVPIMTFADRIEVNPRIMLGKPVIRGTRIPVELILRKLTEGATLADLLDAYPRLRPDDVSAALEYAHRGEWPRGGRVPSWSSR